MNGWARGAFRFLAAIWLPVAGAAVAESWPEFRGPTGQGMSSATNVPVYWSATSNVVWKVPLPGRGWSSPVVDRGRVYLTTAVEQAGELSLRAVCFAARDGKVVWDREVLHPSPAAYKAMHQKNSHASPTPIIASNRIYLHFGHLGTVALDAAGKLVWTQTNLTYSPVHGNGGSPLLWKDRLLVAGDGAEDPFLAALDSGSGKVIWKTPRQIEVRNKFSFCTPVAISLDGETQIISPASGYVGAYRPKDGTEIWRVTYGEGFSVVPRPVFANGLLFVCTGFNIASLMAIRPQGAKGDVTPTHVSWTYRKSVPTTPSLLCVGNEVYFVSDAGIATCVDAETGAVHWSERLGGGFSASPVAAEGRIYFQNESGVGFVVRQGKTYKLEAQNDLGERTLASPALIDGAWFLRSEGHLWRIGN